VKSCRLLRIDELLDSTPPADVAPTLLDGTWLHDLAYIIYTSGSTGRPKGVAVEHLGLAEYLEWAARQYVRGDRLTFPLFTSLSFDLTITSLFLPLITGGTLVVYEETDGPVDAALLDVVDENRADFIKLTPSHLSLLARMNLTSSRIRRMVVGGEDLKTSLAAAVTARFDEPVEIYNEYGPTEAVVGCVMHRYDPATDTGPSVPIGRPADHVRVYVLNDALVPVFATKVRRHARQLDLPDASVEIVFDEGIIEAAKTHCILFADHRHARFFQFSQLSLRWPVP